MGKLRAAAETVATAALVAVHVAKHVQRSRGNGKAADTLAQIETVAGLAMGTAAIVKGLRRAGQTLERPSSSSRPVLDPLAPNAGMRRQHVFSETEARQVYEAYEADVQADNAQNLGHLDPAAMHTLLERMAEQSSILPSDAKAALNSFATGTLEDLPHQAMQELGIQLLQASQEDDFDFTPYFEPDQKPSDTFGFRMLAIQLGVQLLLQDAKATYAERMERDALVGISSTDTVWNPSRTPGEPLPEENQVGQFVRTAAQSVGLDEGATAAIVESTRAPFLPPAVDRGATSGVANALIQAAYDPKVDLNAFYGSNGAWSRIKFQVRALNLAAELLLKEAMLAEG